MQYEMVTHTILSLERFRDFLENKNVARTAGWKRTNESAPGHRRTSMSTAGHKVTYRIGMVDAVALLKFRCSTIKYSGEIVDSKCAAPCCATVVRRHKS